MAEAILSKNSCPSGGTGLLGVQRLGTLLTKILSGLLQLDPEKWELGCYLKER